MSSGNTPPRSTDPGADETRLRHYLLGRLSADERARLERDYFENDNQFGALLAVEDTLVNAYLDHDLAQDERQVFERTFLATPAGRERVRFARSLRGVVARLDVNEPRASTPAATTSSRPHAFSGPSGRRWTLASAAVLVLSAGLWGFSEIARLRNEMERVNAEGETLQREVAATRQQVEREQARADGFRDDVQRLQASGSSQAARQGAGRLVTLSLLPVTNLRAAGVEPARLVLGSDTRVVELELAVDSPPTPEGFRIVVEESERPIAHLETSKRPAQGPGIITAPMPMALFVPGRLYTVKLQRVGGPAVQTIHQYEFRVANR